MAIVSNSIPFVKIKVPKDDFFDILCFDVISPSVFKKHRFILVYFPPSSNHEKQISLANTLFELTTINYDFSIIGDFNLPIIPWQINDLSKSELMLCLTLYLKQI